MANRIVGNVYIIDTDTGATPLSFMTNTKIQTISFWGNGTNSNITLAGANTTNVLAILNLGDVPGNMLNATKSLYLGGVYLTDSMTVPVLQSGTAWIYFS